MFAVRVHYCRYCHVMVCYYFQVRVRSSSECIYGGVWRRCCRGGRAVSIASPSVEQQVRIGLPSEAGVYVCMAGVVVVTLPYLCWPGWHRRELYICQGGSWVRSLPQVLLTLIGASYWKAHIHTTPARPSCIPSTVFIGSDRRRQIEGGWPITFGSIY